jgi:hypothetical protein
MRVDHRHGVRRDPHVTSPPARQLDDARGNRRREQQYATNGDQRSSARRADERRAFGWLWRGYRGRR